MNDIKFYIGPMSKNVVDAILEFTEETDNKIGFLISKKNEKIIDYNNIVNNVNYRIQFAKNGYLQWLEQKNEIISFFSNNLNKKKKNLLVKILFFLDFIKFYLKRLYKNH